MSREFNNKKFTDTFNKHKALLKEALNIKEGSPQEFIDQALTNPQIIKDMRDWVKDCQWGDISDESDVDEFTDIEIVKGVDKAFDGGVEGFIQSGDYKPIAESEKPKSYGGAMLATAQGKIPRKCKKCKDTFYAKKGQEVCSDCEGEYSHSPEMRVRSDEPQFGDMEETSESNDESEFKKLIRECINEVSSDTFSKHSKLLSESIGIKLNEAMEWKDIPDEVKNQAYELIQKHNASVSDDGGGMKKGFYIILIFLIILKNYLIY